MRFPGPTSRPEKAARIEAAVLANVNSERVHPNSSVIGRRTTGLEHATESR